MGSPGGRNTAEDARMEGGAAISMQHESTIQRRNKGSLLQTAGAAYTGASYTGAATLAARVAKSIIRH